MIRSLISKLALLCLLITPAVTAAEQLSLNVGGAKTIKVSRNIDTVFISNPLVADYKVIDENRVVVYGVLVGLAGVIIYDRSGNEIYNAEIIVNQSLTLLKQLVVAHFPGEEIELTNLGPQVVISGTVSSEEVKNKVHRMVGEALKKDSETHTVELTGSGETREVNQKLFFTRKYRFEGVVNNLKVLTTNQINVKLTVAEVSSSFLSEIGVSYSNVGEPGKFLFNQLLDVTAQDIVSLISAKDDDRIGQVLAEPNLSVISGETASFLVGGEIPLAVRRDGEVHFEYKEYGIKLSMVAKVMDVENIRLSLMPEVSSIDESLSESNARFSMPSLRTRKAHTTVQLQDGQSFVLAGLLTTEESEALSRIPFLGDIPLLGALFSHSKTDRMKTELIIVATVNLVEPLNSQEIKLPKFQETSSLERLLRIDFSKQVNADLNRTIQEGGFN